MLKLDNVDITASPSRVRKMTSKGRPTKPIWQMMHVT